MAVRKTTRNPRRSSRATTAAATPARVRQSSVKRPCPPSKSSRATRAESIATGRNAATRCTRGGFSTDSAATARPTWSGTSRRPRRAAPPRSPSWLGVRPAGRGRAQTRQQGDAGCRQHRDALRDHRNQGQRDRGPEQRHPASLPPPQRRPQQSQEDRRGGGVQAEVGRVDRSAGERTGQGAELPQGAEGQPGGPERVALQPAAGLTPRHRGGLVDHEVRRAQAGRPARGEDAGERDAVEGVADAEEQGRGHRRDSGAARGGDTGEGELGGAGEHHEAEHHRLCQAEPGADSDRSEGGPEGAGVETDAERGAEHRPPVTFLLHDVRHRSAATRATSSGATSRAGSRLPTGTCRTRSSRRPTPSSSSPPVAVMAARCAAGSTSPTAKPTRVSRPWTTATVSAEAITPAPSEAAKAIEAKPSSTDLRISWSAPRPRPSESDPRIVSGPTQNTSEAVTKASRKRSRAGSGRSAFPEPPPARPGRVRSHPPRSSSRCSMSTTEPRMPPRSSEPSTISTGAADPPAAASTPPPPAAADSPPISRVTRPRPSVTVSRVRCGSRWPSSRPRPDPTSTATTLTRVPSPGNITRVGPPTAGRSGVEA